MILPLVNISKKLLIYSVIFNTSQPVYVDERGELKIMKDFDERTIWTSDRVPLIASHNRGFNLAPLHLFPNLQTNRAFTMLIFSIMLVDQMQHSLWVAESMNSCVGDHAVSSSHESHSEVFPCRFSFRRIWQAKGYPTAATKVFICLSIDSLYSKRTFEKSDLSST